MSLRMATFARPERQQRLCALHSASRFSFLRRHAARVPKKVPAAVNSHIMMVTAVSLVVIMLMPLMEKEVIIFLLMPLNPPGCLDAGQVRAYGEPD